MDVLADSGGVFGFLAGWLEYCRGDIEAFFDFGDFGAKWRRFWEKIGEYVYDKIRFITNLFAFGILPSIAKHNFVVLCRLRSSRKSRNAAFTEGV